MSTKLVGEFAYFGIVPAQPIVNQPPGKIRVRMRPNQFVEVFVRTSEAIECWHVGKADPSKPAASAGWKLCWLKDRKARVKG